MSLVWAQELERALGIRITWFLGGLVKKAQNKAGELVEAEPVGQLIIMVLLVGLFCLDFFLKLYFLKHLQRKHLL